VSRLSLSAALAAVALETTTREDDIIE